MAIEIGGVTLETFFIFIAVIIITIGFSALANTGLRRVLDPRVKRGNSKLISRVVQYVIIVAGLYVGIVEILGLDLTALFASLGLIALAVAFASQQIIQNTMAGILIYIQRPIQLEDWVEIGGLPSTGIGRVKDITLTRTTLRNADGRIVFIPNSVLLNTKVINFTRAGFTEIPIELRFPSNIDMGRVRKVIEEAVDEDPRLPPNLDLKEERSFLDVLELPRIRQFFDSKPNLDLFKPRVMIKGIGDSEITVEVRVWIREIQHQDVIVSGLLESILGKLSMEGIELS